MRQSSWGILNLDINMWKKDINIQKKTKTKISAPSPKELQHLLIRTKRILKKMASETGGN